jgi:hypothetical protein
MEEGRRGETRRERGSEAARADHWNGRSSGQQARPPPPGPWRRGVAGRDGDEREGLVRGASPPLLAMSESHAQKWPGYPHRLTGVGVVAVPASESSPPSHRDWRRPGSNPGPRDSDHRESESESESATTAVV